MSGIDLATITKSAAFCDWTGIRPGGDVRFELLGHGEYNINYLFRNPSTDEKLVLRIPMGSQMHLDDQARYEFDALRLLEPSGRTPIPLFIDDTKNSLPYGFMVMSFLPGRALDYKSDLAEAAHCLADIHNLDISPDSHLLKPNNPLDAVLSECHAMVKLYMDSDLASPEIKSTISSLLDRGGEIVENTKDTGIRCLINTELNSGNFLVNDKDNTYLVDWEKPLYACPGQDLGHFLAPTTTLWKTDTILTENDIRGFLSVYCDNSSRYSDADALWDDVLPFINMNCLRGITWCAMAWVEYQSPERVLKDDFTFEKIKYYITPEFLERIRKDYVGG